MNLSKSKLIKKCKQYKISTTGTKMEIIDRIIQHERKLNPDIDTKSNLKPMKRKRRKQRKKVDVVLSRNAFHFVLTSYIRLIERSLANNRIIPKDIYYVCCLYLLPNNIFIAFIKIPRNVKNNEKSDTIDIKMWKLGANKAWINKEAQIVPLDTKSVYRQKLEHQQFVYRSTMGICVGLNVPLPSKINALLSSRHSSYDMVFTVGGTSATASYWKGNYWSKSVKGAIGCNKCAAFIINDSQKKGTKIHNFPLPDLPFYLSEQCMAYHHKYGLFCAGGTKKGGKEAAGIKSVQRLTFDSDDYMKQDYRSSYTMRQWKWQKMKSLKIARLGPQGIIIGDKFLVCGGRDIQQQQWSGGYYGHYRNNCNHIQSVEFLDFENMDKGWKKLRNMNYGRWRAGICADDIHNIVYIAGGEGNSSQRIEKYDMVKNKWLNVANTKFAYFRHPLIWLDDVDPHIIHICSSKLDKRLETLDMRMPNEYSNEYRQYTYDDWCQGVAQHSLRLY